MDIGPKVTNNPGAIYKSRPLSTMIRSAESMRSLKHQSIFPDESMEEIVKHDDYLTKEFEFDIE
ncbi:hypothetical protein C1645_818738 [Glomus cerebriforme]|uniref:Uncharacterized protein n=1 Tax=Glomus cerebriforme TaxID=658196 RepID=A0A397T6Z7_9GLOM|nr:hypothetical protein C1645_818738 [Glomus cerebriforme]